MEIYLDTHVVIWLYAGQIDRLSGKAKHLIERNRLFICPIVQLELKYLQEISRITAEPALIIENLASKINLEFCPKPFLEVVAESMLYEWTRDPFDRIIVAAAASSEAILITKDKIIHENYCHAVWE